MPQAIIEDGTRPLAVKDIERLVVEGAYALRFGFFGPAALVLIVCKLKKILNFLSKH